MSLSHSPKIVTDGLVLCLDAANPRSYPKSGTTWSDLTGSENGTLTNMDAANFSSDNRGILSFDGSNEIVSFSDKDKYSFGDYNSDYPFTLETFFNCSNVSSGAFFKGLIGKDNGSSREWALLIVSGTSKVRVFIKNRGGGDQQSIDTTSTISNNTWYHAVATYDGSGGSSAYTGLKLYINGVFESPTSTFAQGYVAMSNTSANLTVGNYFGSSNYFNGKIATTRIYNRALTADEVRQNYNATKRRFK